MTILRRVIELGCLWWIISCGAARGRDVLAALEDVGVAWITSRLKRADPLRRDYRSHPGEGPFVGLYVVVFLPTRGEMDAL